MERSWHISSPETSAMSSVLADRDAIQTPFSYVCK
jgi:hypothetical protein